MKAEFQELEDPVNLVLEVYLVKKAYPVYQENLELKELLVLADSLVIKVIEVFLVSMVYQGREEIRETMGQLGQLVRLV